MLGRVRLDLLYSVALLFFRFDFFGVMDLRVGLRFRLRLGLRLELALGLVLGL